MSKALRAGSRFLAVVALSGLVGACSWIQDDDEKDVLAPLPVVPEQSVDLRKNWSHGVGSQGDDVLSLQLKPAIAGGSIYAANAKGRVVAISLADGDTRWKTSIDGEIISAVGAGGDLVVVSSSDGVVHALSAANGEEVWRTQASSEVVAAASCNGDVVVVQSVDSRVQAFDAAKGIPRWSYKATQAVLSLRGNSAPVIRDNTVYAAFDNGKVAALDARTGLMEWEQRFIVPDGRSELERVIDVQGDPLVTETDVIVGTYQGAIADVGRERGQLQWEEKASVARSMAIGEGSVFVVEGNDAVRAIRQGSGSEAWKAEIFSNRRLSAPAVIGNYVAVADKEGYVHLLNQTDGSYAGRYSVGGGGVRNDLLSDGDVLYVLTNSGKLYALTIRS